jgi:hypothetical protein
VTSVFLGAISANLSLEETSQNPCAVDEYVETDTGMACAACGNHAQAQVTDTFGPGKLENSIKHFRTVRHWRTIAPEMS